MPVNDGGSQVPTHCWVMFMACSFLRIWDCNRAAACETVAPITAVAVSCVRMQTPVSQDERQALLLAALLLPLRAASIPGKGNKSTPLASWIVKEGIKWTNRDADGVVALHQEAAVLLQVSQQLQVRPATVK